jgi:predicted enzyme related to lactoylglutathione lyase
MATPAGALSLPHATCRRGSPHAPVNALGHLRVMFAVNDIDETLERLHKRGAQLVGEVVQHKTAYRLCYIRGPEGLLIGLAQELN